MGHFIGAREQRMMENRAALAMRRFITSAKLFLTGKGWIALTLSPPPVFPRRTVSPRWEQQAWGMGLEHVPGRVLLGGLCHHGRGASTRVLGVFVFQGGHVWGLYTLLDPGQKSEGENSQLHRQEGFK